MGDKFDQVSIGGRATLYYICGEQTPDHAQKCLGKMEQAGDGMRPLLLINLKTYQEGSGPRAVYISQIAEKVAKEEKVSIAVAVQAPDIFKITSLTEALVFSQHVDGVEFGPYTGRLLPETVRRAGAVGTLLNHAEQKLPLETLKKTVERCKASGLKVVVCAARLEEVRMIARLKPEYIAFEYPALIGSGKAISQFRSEDVRTFAGLLNNSAVTPLCGAGISSPEDVRAALALGTRGVMLSSAVVKSQDPETLIREMAQALKF